MCSMIELEKENINRVIKFKYIIQIHGNFGREYFGSDNIDDMKKLETFFDEKKIQWNYWDKPCFTFVNKGVITRIERKQI